MLKKQLGNWSFGFFLLAQVAFTLQIASAQDSPKGLLERLETLRQPPQFNSKAEEDAARAEFAVAWADFKKYLDASGPTIRASWEAFLEWRNLELLGTTPVKLNEDVIERLRRQFRQNAAGFEYGPFARVRAALDRLAGVAMRVELADMNMAYTSKMDELLAALQARRRSDKSRLAWTQ